MASPSMMPPLPPGSEDSAPQAPTSPTAASPSPAQPAPATNQGTQLVLGVIRDLRSIAKAYPEAAPHITQINDLMRKVMQSMMQSAQPGEAQAPPT